MLFTLEELHSSWRPLFTPHIDEINEILATVIESELSPSRERVFRAFQYPLDEIRVLILGQDPYPGAGVADGLAFSSPQGNPIPASLRNIFKEYADDLALPLPSSPDLSPWMESGVLLLNRTLTTSIGERNAHAARGWKNLTLVIAKALADRDVVAILWGNDARELAPLFRYVVESVHPSPLSARRGFFGSKPFTRSNKLLRQLGRQEINWQL